MSPEIACLGRRTRAALRRKVLFQVGKHLSERSEINPVPNQPVHHEKNSDAGANGDCGPVHRKHPSIRRESHPKPIV
jgi:hypothetical protein